METVGVTLGKRLCCVKFIYYEKTFGAVSHVDSHSHLNGSGNEMKK